MKTKSILVLMALIVALYTVGAVSAVSQWEIGDEVKLIVTTTNMGSVNVIQSTGRITVRSPCGLLYDAGPFHVQGNVPPGESVDVPLNWNSTGAAPGEYDIILDGELKFANEQYEETYSVVEDAFLLYDPISMLCEVPDVVTDGYISGLTMVSDTCYKGDAFFFVVWVNNTGSTLFIPEIVVTFEGEDYDSGPLNYIYCEDPCEPGLNPIAHMCQLPEDMEAGEYQCSVDMNMHYLDVDIVGPEATETTYLDCFTCEETDPEADTLLYRWVFLNTEFEDNGIDVERYLEEPSVCYYDFGQVLVEEEVWPTPDYGDGYCFRWFYNGEQVVPNPDEELFCQEEVDPIYEDYQIRFLEEAALSGTLEVDDLELYEFTLDEPALGLEPEQWLWTWEPSFGDEGYHDILVEVRERSTTDVGASDLITVFVERKLATDEPHYLYVWVTNDGDYAFEPEFTLSITELDDHPVPTLYGDTILAVAPPGTSIHKLEVDVSDVPPSEEGYYFELSVEPVQIFDMELPDDPELATDAIYYRFFRDNEVMLSGDLSFDEQWENQIEANNKWRWTVSENDWESTGPHTVYVEVTDNPYDPDYDGEGDRVGIASIDVTIGDGGSEGETDDSTDDTEGSNSTDGSNPSGTTGGTEPEEETAPEEEPQGFSIQSIIDMILSFFQNLFG